MSWAGGPRLGYDCESTGVNVFEDRIVTASTVLVEPGVRPVIERWVIDPGVDIPAEATAIHGLTTKYVREHGRPPAEALFEFTGAIALAMHRGVPLIGFNAAFDLSILEAENRRHELPTLAERLGGVIRNVVDPFVIDKEVDKYRKGSRKLSAVCEHYGVTLAGAHDSSADALAAVRLATVLAARFPAIGKLPIEDLHTAQVEWFREQCASLADWFTKQGKDISGIDGSWPVRPAPAQVSA